MRSSMLIMCYAKLIDYVLYVQISVTNYSKIKHNR